MGALETLSGYFLCRPIGYSSLTWLQWSLGNNSLLYRREENEILMDNW